MIKHAVFVKFKPDIGEEQIERARNSLAALPAKIPEIQEYSFGKDVVRLEYSPDVALVSVFRDPDALKRTAPGIVRVMLWGDRSKNTGLSVIPGIARLAQQDTLEWQSRFDSQLILEQLGNQGMVHIDLLCDYIPDEKGKLVSSSAAPLMGLELDGYPLGGVFSTWMMVG